MKVFALTLIFLASMAAQAERQLGFLIPIGDEAPLDVKKFKAVECQYEVMCYPVYAIKELQNGKKIYEIRTVETSDKPHPLVREGELPMNYQSLEVFLNTAMLDFIGADQEIASNPEQPAKPIWMNYIEHPKPLGVALSKEKKEMLDYQVYDKPDGKKISKDKITWSNIMSWTYSVCEKFDCKVPYYEVQESYYKVLAPPVKLRAPSSLDTFSGLPGDEPKYVWLKNANLDGKADTDAALTEKIETEMFRPHYPQLRDIDVIAVKTIGTQVWLQVDFLKAGRCDATEKAVVGRGWIPAFKSDDSFNVLWHPRGC
jgi:hypothetical protein